MPPSGLQPGRDKASKMYSAAGSLERSELSVELRQRTLEHATMGKSGRAVQISRQARPGKLERPTTDEPFPLLRRQCGPQFLPACRIVLLRFDRLGLPPSGHEKRISELEAGKLRNQTEPFAEAGLCCRTKPEPPSRGSGLYNLIIHDFAPTARRLEARSLRHPAGIARRVPWVAGGPGEPTGGGDPGPLRKRLIR